jgi:hypothetical protein
MVYIERDLKVFPVSIQCTHRQFRGKRLGYIEIPSNFAAALLL